MKEIYCTYLVLKIGKGVGQLQGLTNPTARHPEQVLSQASRKDFWTTGKDKFY